MSRELLRIASVLDKSGHYELSDKLFSIAQNKVNEVVNQGIAVKERADTARGAVDIISSVSKFFQRNIPTFIKTLESLKSNLNKFESIPAIDKILAGLDLKSFIDNTVNFLGRVNQSGFANYYNTDAKEVTDFFISFASTINMLANYIPLLAPIKIQMQAIDTSLNALGMLVNGSAALGNYVGTTNTSLRNFSGVNSEQETSKRLPVSINPDAGGKNINDVAMVGEVFNVLLDYVNRRGTLQALVNKHIPDWDPQKPEKMAQVQSYISQNNLPPKNAAYQISSYKIQKDASEKRKRQEDLRTLGFSRDGY